MAKALFGYLPGDDPGADASTSVGRLREQIAALREQMRQVQRENELLVQRLRAEQPAGSEELLRGWGRRGGTAVAVGGNYGEERDDQEPLEVMVAATADGLETLALIVDDLKASVQTGMTEILGLLQPQEHAGGLLDDTDLIPEDGIPNGAVGTRWRGYWHYAGLGVLTLNPFPSPASVERLRGEYDAVRGVLSQTVEPTERGDSQDPALGVASVLIPTGNGGCAEGRPLGGAPFACRA